MKKIIVEGIEVNVTRKKIKNINLSVHPPYGEVRISAPFKATDKIIKSFIKSKIAWIQKHQSRFKNQEQIVHNQYNSGESHFILGENYKLNIIYIDKNPQEAIISADGYINLYIKKDSPREKRAEIIKELRRRELKLRIPPLIEKWEKIMGVEVEEFGVKQMKTRWGTCNISDRRIWINLELSNKPLSCLEYIVVHEMVHLLERNHNEKFTAHMDQFLPNWRTIKAELNNYTS